MYQSSMLMRAAGVAQQDIARGCVLAQHVVRRAVNGNRVVLPLASVHLQEATRESNRVHQ